MVWLLTDIAQIQVGSQLILIMILSASVLALFGLRHTARLILPILILISATSLWSVLSQPLQLPTAAFVNQMLHITGYTSFQESYFITIPEGIFEVGDTCSGLRYQIAAITLAIIYSFFSHYSFRHALVYLLLASGVAFISNCIRIYIVVLSGHYTNMTHSLLNDHIWLGWVVFVICYAGFMFATVSYEKKLKIGAKLTRGESDEVAVIRGDYIKTIFIASVIILSASVGPIYSVILKSFNGMSGRHVVSSFDLNELPEVAVEKRWQPTWVNMDFEKRSAYKVADINVDLYIAYYKIQEQGKEAVASANQAYNRDRWSRAEHVIKELTLSGGHTIPIQEEIIVDNKGRQRLVWLWYYIGGKSSADSLQGKLNGILGTLKGRHDAAAILISADKTDDGNLQRKSMQRLVGVINDKIEQHDTLQQN
jgi:EpsI family protein